MKRTFKKHYITLSEYIRRTYKAKIWALMMITLGFISTFILEDGGVFVLALFLGLPVFFMDCKDED